jgi:hypothetical protein
MKKKPTPEFPLVIRALQNERNAKLHLPLDMFTAGNCDACDVAEPFLREDDIVLIKVFTYGPKPYACSDCLDIVAVVSRPTTEDEPASLCILHSDVATVGPPALAPVKFGEERVISDFVPSAYPVGYVEDVFHTALVIRRLTHETRITKNTYFRNRFLFCAFHQLGYIPALGQRPLRHVLSFIEKY